MAGGQFLRCSLKQDRHQQYPKLVDGSKMFQVTNICQKKPKHFGQFSQFLRCNSFQHLSNVNMKNKFNTTPTRRANQSLLPLFERVRISTNDTFDLRREFPVQSICFLH